MTLITDKADLLFSTQGRAGTPDGNIFLDVSDPANPKIELIAVSEQALIDYGGGAEANRLDDSDGVTMQAIYGAISDHRLGDETIRQFRKPMAGKFLFAGAYDLINNNQFATAPDLALIRSSGIRYLSVSGAINRIYFGPKSLGTIEAASQAYYQTTLNGTAVDFGALGPIDGLVQVFGTTANGDASAGDFDLRAYFAVSVREYGQIHDRKDLSDSGFQTSDFFVGGFGLTEGPHPTTATFAEADVIGGGAIAPFSTMAFQTEAVTVSRSGFNEADGDFIKTVLNPAGGTLDEVVAFLDALARETSDIDDGTPTRIGKDHPTLYSFDAQGRVIMEQGVYVANLPGSDLTRIILTDDGGNVKTFPSLVSISVSISAAAQADPNAWYHAFIEDDTDADDYNTATAITHQDKDAVEIKGSISSAGTINWDVNFSAIPGGTNIPAATSYQVRFIVGGDPDSPGGPVENFTVFTIDGTSNTLSPSVSNETEQNV